MKRLIAMVLVALTLAAVPARAQEAAKGFVERLLESVLSAEGRSLSIEGTSISFSGDVTVAKVTVRDGTNSWLEIENLALVWRPLSLFGKQLDVTSLTADRVHVFRLPQSPEGKVAAPQELKDLRAAIIRELSIARLQIDSPVLGQDVEMKLAGSAEITAAPIKIRADMTASRLDGRKGDLSARVVLDPQTRQVTVDAGFSEEADGIVARLLSLRGRPSVDLAVSAAGSFSDWDGQFSLSLDKAERFAGTARAASADGAQTISVDGGGELAALLPAWLERPFAGRSTLSVRAMLPAGAGAAEIDHITLDNAAYGFSAGGTLDWTGTRSNLTARLMAKDAKAAFDLPVTALGQGSVAGLAVEAQVTGPLTAPAWHATLGWGALATDRITLEQTTAKLAGQGLAPLGFTGDFAATAMQGRVADLPPALLGPWRGSITGTRDASGRLDIASSSLTTGAVALESKGQVDTSSGRFDLTIAAKADSPVTGMALADRFLDGPVTAQGHVTGDGGGMLTLDGVNLTSDALAAVLSGTVSGRDADMTLDLTLADLGRLHEGLSGAARFDARVAGAWDALTAQLRGTGTDVTLMGKALDAPQVSADVVDLVRAPQGHVSASGRLAGKPVDVQAAFETDAEGTLVLPALSARAGAATLTGTLRWPRDSAPTASLTFDAPDLAEVAPLFLTEMAGSAAGSVTMTGTGSEHDTAIRFTGKSIATPSFAAKSATGNIHIAALFDVPRPSGEVALVQARIGGQRFDEARLTATATGSNAYRVAARLSGQDLSLSGNADVTIDGSSARYAVSGLSGKLRGVPFSSAKTVVLTQQGERLSLETTTLRVGKGSVTAGGQLLPRLDAKLRIAALPLAALQGLANQPGLQGIVTAEADLTGPPAAPEGRFRVAVTGAATESLRRLGIKPVSMTGSGTLKAGTASVTLKAEGGRDLSVTGNGSVALDGSRLDMTLAGRIGAAVLADRLAQSGIRAGGTLAFDVRLAGPVRTPEVNGRISLSKGLLGDAAGRFTLRDAAGTAEIRGRTIRIVTLSGVTGRNGRATATGTIGLEGDLPANLDVTVTNGMYTDGSFVTARYDARLKISGPLLSAPLATGEIDLRGTKITLSELPQRALTPDDVKHINASRAILLQDRELRRNRPTGQSNLRVDVRLRAVDDVSVSGRGLHVVLTGGLRIYGPIDGLAADGAFHMVRGRLTLPARSLDFERGTLTFDRDLDPKIDFVAVSRRKDATITLAVSGYASEPSIQVTSSPQLPPEEAMARLIFDSSMLQLSPLQIAQIASYVATLSGGGDSGLLSGLQNALGLDQLSITEGEGGDTQVGLTKRLNDRLSVGVEQSTQNNTTRAIIDLSATPELKVRGSIDSQGSSRIGVYYEKDY